MLHYTIPIDNTTHCENYKHDSFSIIREWASSGSNIAMGINWGFSAYVDSLLNQILQIKAIFIQKLTYLIFREGREFMESSAQQQPFGSDWVWSAGTDSCIWQ